MFHHIIISVDFFAIMIIITNTMIMIVIMTLIVTLIVILIVTLIMIMIIMIVVNIIDNIMIMIRINSVQIIWYRRLLHISKYKVNGKNCGFLKLIN